MSNPVSQSQKAAFASKTPWDALGVESGEESEEEEQIEEPVETAR